VRPGRKGQTFESKSITTGCLLALNAGSAEISLNAASSCWFCSTKEVLFCCCEAISLLQYQPDIDPRGQVMYFLFRSRLPSPYLHSALSNTHFSQRTPPVHLALSALHLSHACDVLLGSVLDSWKVPSRRGRISFPNRERGDEASSDERPLWELSGFCRPDMAMTWPSHSLHIQLRALSVSVLFPETVRNQSLGPVIGASSSAYRLGRKRRIPALRLEDILIATPWWSGWQMSRCLSTCVLLCFCYTCFCTCFCSLS